MGGKVYIEATRTIYVSQYEDPLQLVSSMIAPNGIAYKYLSV